jgi:hypothetical protein
LPTIIRAQIATSASLPKPAKKSMERMTTSPSRAYGNAVSREQEQREDGQEQYRYAVSVK